MPAVGEVVNQEGDICEVTEELLLQDIVHSRGRTTSEMCRDTGGGENGQSGGRYNCPAW